MDQNKKLLHFTLIIICIVFTTFLSCITIWFIDSKYGLNINNNENNTLIHIDTANQSHCITAVNVSKGINGIKVKTKEFGELYLSNGTYIIIDSGVCPYCKTETSD